MVEIANLKQARESAACSGFNEKIVVCGGSYTELSDNRYLTKTVQAYDHISNTWSYLLSMVEERAYCKSLAVRNKLYAIG